MPESSKEIQNIQSLVEEGLGVQVYIIILLLERNGSTHLGVIINFVHLYGHFHQCGIQIRE